MLNECFDAELDLTWDALAQASTSYRTTVRIHLSSPHWEVHHTHIPPPMLNDQSRVITLHKKARLRRVPHLV